MAPRIVEDESTRRAREERPRGVLPFTTRSDVLLVTLRTGTRIVHAVRALPRLVGLAVTRSAVAVALMYVLRRIRVARRFLRRVPGYRLAAVWTAAALASVVAQLRRVAVGLCACPGTSAAAALSLVLLQGELRAGVGACARERRLRRQMAVAQCYEEWARAAEALRTLSDAAHPPAVAQRLEAAATWAESDEDVDGRRALLEPAYGLSRARSLRHEPQRLHAGSHSPDQVLEDCVTALRAARARPSRPPSSRSGAHRDGSAPAAPQGLLRSNPASTVAEALVADARLGRPMTVAQMPPAVSLHLAEVRRVLHVLVHELPELPGFGLRERLDLLQETVYASGRAALVLSGGGMLGTFHVGVARELFSRRLLPRVIAGSSAGAIVAAVLCTRTDDELERDFFKVWPRPGEPCTELFLSFFGGAGLRTLLTRLARTGALYACEDLRTNLRKLLGDLTFQEAYERTGRILAISVSPSRWHEAPRLLNYLTAPHCVVWSAVAASCAFPGLYAPQTLLARDRQGRFVHATLPGALATDTLLGTDAASAAVAVSASSPAQRRWRDGSVEADLPLRQLAELFSVSYTVVSQTNPYVIPVWNLLRSPAWVRNPLLRRVGRLLEEELRHVCRQAKLLLSLVGTRSRLWDILSTIGQAWEGDITLANAASMRQVLSAGLNPRGGAADLALMTAQGARATWAALPALTAVLTPNLAIEAAADDIRRQLRERWPTAAAEHRDVAAIRAHEPTRRSLSGLRGAAAPLSYDRMLTVVLPPQSGRALAAAAAQQQQLQQQQPREQQQLTPPDSPPSPPAAPLSTFLGLIRGSVRGSGYFAGGGSFFATDDAAGGDPQVLAALQDARAASRPLRPLSPTAAHQPRGKSRFSIELQQQPAAADAAAAAADAAAALFEPVTPEPHAHRPSFSFVAVERSSSVLPPSLASAAGDELRLASQRALNPLAAPLLPLPLAAADAAVSAAAEDDARAPPSSLLLVGANAAPVTIPLVPGVLVVEPPGRSPSPAPSSSGVDADVSSGGVDGGSSENNSTHGMQGLLGLGLRIARHLPLGALLASPDSREGPPRRAASWSASLADADHSADGPGARQRRGSADDP